MASCVGIYAIRAQTYKEQASEALKEERRGVTSMADFERSLVELKDADLAACRTVATALPELGDQPGPQKLNGGTNRLLRVTGTGREQVFAGDCMEHLINEW